MLIHTIETLAANAVRDLQAQGFMANWYTLIDGTIQVQWVEGNNHYWVKLNGGET